MGLDTPILDKTALKSLVGDMNTSGFAVINSFLPPDSLAEMRHFVAQCVKNAGGGYVAFSGRDSIAATPLGPLATQSRFKDLIKGVYEEGVGKPAPEVTFYELIRCLRGRSGQKQSMIFHYDSYVVTALLPIEMPSTGRRGDLLMLPNTRRIRQTYLQNLIDKVFLDNAATQWLLKFLIERQLIRYQRLRLVPGNLYLFWGYRSIHTNEACDPDQIRATALFHFMDPHAESTLRNLMRPKSPQTKQVLGAT